MPLTQTTRGQALAMYVVYDSPLQMVSDDPSAYRDSAGEAPTSTSSAACPRPGTRRFPSGEPGEQYRCWRGARPQLVRGCHDLRYGARGAPTYVPRPRPLARNRLAGRRHSKRRAAQ